MRTTITLDPGVAAEVKKRMRENGLSFNAAVNGALREAFAAAPHARRPVFRYRSLATHMGLRPGLNLDKIDDVLDLIEDPEHR